ncbi:O-methyltransferase [Mucilaginibacter limnophilus]|uniref:O-methyltransferase n=1 Tax=Mucilaginibacter limnophilus TaxID=1932778 RepID=A0A3S2UMF7_9SPHI|nr:O-methyltransferase [Mucilaginibacter limnophilus]RVU01310.1 O-methyltransferase [Mucilaginibacter limnophilus]
MEILDPTLQAYLEAHTDPEPAHLQKINRDTHLKVLKPNMLSGHYQGRLLSILSKMLRPKLAVEIGTFTGYSAICLAEGLAEDGVLHTIEVNQEMEDTIKNNLQLTNVEKKIITHFGAAADIIADFQWQNIDLVFIDADKRNNFTYFELLVNKVRSGGLIIIDNVLWKGKVYGPEKDADTESFRKLNEQIAVDTRVEKLILPVRDGLLLIQKK